ncbi:MAG TPA: peptide ABC transporter substrate-binding protein [Candidatus Limnocylindria bacterium]|nr:peptide ABC transporter substrate-binding protein [Candidatus Limnocylindria bacterium]
MQRTFTALACLLVLSSCGVAPRPVAEEPWKTESELVTNIGFEPETIDPQKATFATEIQAAMMVYEPLLTYDPATLTLLPAAARALPDVSTDGRVYTYTLRPGLTYSDGVPLTAEHFANAWRRLCDPRSGGDFAFLAYLIEGCEKLNMLDRYRATAAEYDTARSLIGVRALDDVTIRFTLREPAAHFPQITALSIGAPMRPPEVEHGRLQGAQGTELDRYVGNGPYRLVEWKRHERMVFERNERYRSPVRLLRWTKVMIRDSDVARRAYDDGRLDVLAVVPRTDAEREELLVRTDLRRSPGPCTSYVAFNTKAPPFDDERVRLAFAKALDKEEFARTVERTARAAPSLVPHGQPSHAHDDRVQAFDPVVARRLLTESGYGAPSGGRLGAPIRVLFSASPQQTARAQWLIAQWRAYLGVEIIPDPVVAGGHGPLIKRGPSALQIAIMGWCQDYPDGEAWYGALFRKNGIASSRTQFDDPALVTLLDQAERERDPLERQLLFERASSHASRTASVAWLAWSENWLLVRPEVKGYELTSFDSDFAQFSLARVYRSAP